MPNVRDAIIHPYCNVFPCLFCPKFLNARFHSRLIKTFRIILAIERERQREREREINRERKQETEREREINRVREQETERKRERQIER